MKLTAVIVLLQACLVLAGFYDSNPNVLELNHKNFDKVVYGTNYTTVVEFYAPWCGHCKNLKRTYSQVGKYFKDLVQVAAINCDLAENKPVCSKYRVEGFPTVMVFRPPKDYGKGKRHATEVYKGEREFDKIVAFVKTRIKSFVSRIKPDGYETFRKADFNEDHRALLITDKKKVPVTLKSLAIDFLGSVKVGYMPVKEGELSKVNELLGTKFETLPQLVIIHEDGPQVYSGEFNKLEMSKFVQKFVKPKEGPLSDRGKWLSKLGLGMVKDEL
ncbi:unnamed protein product [Kuraishia capsulata CBS 1993]|uniref:Thioredoxin domain-containing protein n=1 Tax=Kuraishia capsulata CBS 1993 TaxID=1382522 RepID=W6MXG7_9ASCO|nr:uncharacterized protein KUCA_T00004845001 [Kuraishia capsulata CBS 1993]CDK28860.1 unnamed protein product [Kuraishia capsulata CBS 1993]